MYTSVLMLAAITSGGTTAGQQGYPGYYGSGGYGQGCYGSGGYGQGCYGSSSCGGCQGGFCSGGYGCQGSGGYGGYGGYSGGYGSYGSYSGGYGGYSGGYGAYAGSCSPGGGFAASMCAPMTGGIISIAPVDDSKKKNEAEERKKIEEEIRKKIDEENKKKAEEDARKKEIEERKADKELNEKRFDMLNHMLRSLEDKVMGQDRKITGIERRLGAPQAPETKAPNVGPLIPQLPPPPPALPSLPPAPTKDPKEAPLPEVPNKIQTPEPPVVPRSTGEEQPLPKIPVPFTAKLGKRALVRISMPANTTLYVDDKKVSAPAGGTQSVLTPELVDGDNYYYQVRAEVVHEGQVVQFAQRVRFTAGAEVRVNFQERLTQYVLAQGR